MRLLELKQPNIIVVYGGGFQPFHEGHMSSYRQAKSAFPGAHFFVAASNVTSERPFEFTEKKFLAQQAGVRDPFIQVGTMSYVNDAGRKVTSTPLNPLEVLQKFNPERDVLVIIRSERDPMKTTATSYYQPWAGAGNMEPFGRHAYIYVTKKHDFSIAGNPVYSGSQVRELYTSADDATKMQILHDLYPQSRQLEKIKQIFDSRLGTVDEASLATMRDYFAGQEDAKDQTKIAQMRDYYSKLGKAGDQRSGQKKEFRSVHDYVQWLEKNHKTVSPGTKK
jgi:cytidyltransferase-like protein